MPKRFCIGCDQLTDSNTTRCPTCQAKATKRRQRRPNTTARGLGAAHRAAAKAVLAQAQVCHWCGKPPTADNPLTADHVVARVHGGGDGPLVAAHRSCNSQRGGQTRRRRKT